MVPKGTIILEDTRGLHKAGIPKKGYPDLGFALLCLSTVMGKPDYTMVNLQVKSQNFKTLRSTDKKMLSYKNF